MASNAAPTTELTAALRYPVWAVVNRRKVVACMVVGWAVVFIVSFVLMKTTPPTGDGFARGLNRLGVFISWQAVAVSLAIIVWVAGLRQFPESAKWRWTSRLPLAVQLLLVLGVVSTFGYFAWFNKPEPYVNTLQPTAPAVSLEETPTTVAPTAATSAVEPEPVPQLETFQGVIHRVFETSHFYTLDGGGPFWLEASEPAWEKLNEHFVERGGRGSGILVIATFEGHRGDAIKIETLGSYEARVFAERVDAARTITQQEFELVLNQR